ncbi:ABC transporter permease subunit [Acidithiobacillus sp.]|uniref:ABC transporter permease n=1 Tax=Acidithiobacillus sp. TaxID=1872118 RepID=UPI0025C0215D|nr:ABC transporter permease subunit [Acidithiobacillus sp.]
MSRVHNAGIWLALRGNRQDLLLLPLVVLGFFTLSHAIRQMAVPFSIGQPLPISTEPNALFDDALFTTLRMLAAVLASLLFTVVYATLAAKNRYAGKILIPLLDILQSVPILGYLSITVTGFIALFPGSLVGVQLAVIFAVFTSQVWNMTFAFYQALITLPHDLDEAARLYRLNAWQRFFRLELPFAVPPLLWNTMMSMSGGWFFVVAAEAITVAGHEVMVPGIGSYIAMAIQQKDLVAIFWAILAMIVVIGLYDFLLFRPLVAWADKFKWEIGTDLQRPRSIVLEGLRRSRIAQVFARLLEALWEISLRWLPPGRPHWQDERPPTPWRDGFFSVAMVLALGLFSWHLVETLLRHFSTQEIVHVFLLGLVTGLRVFILVVLSLLVWVPVGILVGLRPGLSGRVQAVIQFLAAFPANLLFPLVVLAILRWHLNVNVWVSPLMILGSQWYVLFNVIGAAAALPSDLKEAARNLGLRGWLLWKRLLLPGTFPGTVTGGITASGGAWNASIVAEVVSWGHHTLIATGLGAYITLATAAGQLDAVALGIGVMSFYVVLVNRLFWRRLYHLAAHRLRLD